MCVNFGLILMIIDNVMMECRAISLRIVEHFYLTNQKSLT